MSLLRFQVALTRVYLDSSLRLAIREGGSLPALDLQLSEAEMQSLRTLVCGQSGKIDLFSTTLRKKRERLIKGFCPLLESYLGPVEFARLLVSYCEKTTPRAETTASDDASTFWDFVAERYSVPVKHKLAFADLMLLEQTKAKTMIDIVTELRIARGDAVSARSVNSCPFLNPSASLKIFRHHPRALAIWAHSRGDRLITSVHPPLNVVFFCHPESGKNTTIVVRPAVASILSSVDGKATVEQIGRAVLQDRDVSEANFAEGILQALTALANAGVVEFRYEKC